MGRPASSRRSPLAIAIIAASATACAALSTIFTPDPLRSRLPPGSIHLPAAYAKAAGIAVTSAINQLKHEVEEANKASGPNALRDALLKCFGQPEAYDAHVGFDVKTDRYIVVVEALSERCLEGSSQFVHGGGYFEISPVSFEIVAQRTGEDGDPAPSSPDRRTEYGSARRR